jgi:uncharacterized protein YdaU (DUF1376 family)
MAKDPAVLWYWNDWQGGTMTLTRHQKGCYMDLLSAQFNSGPLSLDQVKTVLGTDQAIWTVLSTKFKKEVNSDGNEVFFNERMESEKLKRKEHSSKQSDNAKKRWSGNANAYPKSVPLENANENRDAVLKKGVLRGKNFTAEEVGELNLVKLGAACELLKISKGIDATTEQVEGLWEIFKIQNLTGEKYYSSVNEIHSHFINWIKNQNVNTDRKTAPHSAKTAGAYELLEMLRTGGKAHP